MRSNERSLLVAALLVLLASRAGADVIDRILAVVNGQPITLSDVAAHRQIGLIPVPPETQDHNGYVLERLIDRALILREVDRFQPPEPDPVSITIVVDEIERRTGSAAALDRILAVTGMTREQLRRHLRDNQRITIYMNERFSQIADPVDRGRAQAVWMSELRRRAAITVIYRATEPPPGRSR